MGCCDSKVEPRNQESSVRGCTDVFWLVIYIIFWAVMVLIAVFSFVYGSPIRLINGYDSFGNTCGKKYNPVMGDLTLSGRNTLHEPYLFFMDMKELKKALKICVKQCPSRNLNSVQELKDFYGETGSNLCQYDFNFVNVSKNPESNVFSNPLGPCPALPVYDSTPVLNRCVPRPVKDLAENILNNFYGLLNSWDALEQILGDLYSTWRELLGLAGLALVLSLVMVSILHWMASIASYLVMILVSVASVVGTAFLWYTYIDIRRGLDSDARKAMLMEAVRNETAFLVYSIIATVITVVILILVLVMRKQVSFLADLFRQTSRCLLAIPALLLQPLLTSVVLILFLSCWLSVVLCLATAYYPGTSGLAPFPNLSTYPSSSSASTPAPNNLQLSNISLSSITSKFTIVEYVDPLWVKYMWWFYLVGLIWGSEFIMACQQMVVAGAVAHWYYRRQYRTTDHVSYAFSKLVKYHLGSMALGSLVITLFKIPRLILTYAYAKSRKEELGECAKCCLRGCLCCFYCLEKFIRYLNHNAYTVIAIDGTNFCVSARTAFEVLVAHALQVATINSVGDFILFLAKCIVTALTGVVGLAIFRQDSRLTFYAAPTLIACVEAFFVAHCILSVYEMVLDTLYLCMCQDKEKREDLQMEQVEQLQEAAPTFDNNGQL